MKTKVTTKNCRLSKISSTRLDKHISRFSKRFKNREDPKLDLYLHKTLEHYHHPRSRHNLKHGYGDHKTALTRYEGTMVLSLRETKFLAAFKGQSISECFKVGFDKLEREVEKYKELHYKGDSKYPHHDSIRKQVFFARV